MSKQTLHKIFITNILCILLNLSFAQVNYTANDRVIPYDGSFRYGVNMGYYPNWTSEQLGNISAGNASLGLKGVGINSARPALYEENLETFGYDALVSTFEGFYQKGIRDMTVIVGGPSGAHRDYTQYCPSKFSDMFANLYEPIWDGGLNGTPVNEKNYYALYLWKTVTNYKKYVKIWEIVNEPDFDESITQWRTDFDLNVGWWRNNPDPCTYQLHAPIFNYIRMLRISWEIVKSVDPNAYVSVGALGYASFLDLVMRNTDNPNNGAVSADFPLKGGAYFDIMGYHIYPHIDASLWTYDIRTDRILGFHRHSDGAIDSGLVKKQAFFQSVLTKYGYDGSKYPQKPWVVTEFNLPRRAFDQNYVGSNELQRNSIIKAAVECYQRQILQLHVYQLGDRATAQEATFEFEEMGLYNKLSALQPYNVKVNQVGIAYKTVSDMLAPTKFDANQTRAMNLTSNIDGAAFKKADGSFVYVIWAKTTIDKSENANASYSFPASFNVTGLKRHEWDFSESNQATDINPQNIALTASPIFLTGSSVVVPVNLPDLVLSNLNLDNATVQQGQTLGFKVDVKNMGTGTASGNFNVKSYISKDNILGADDIQAGNIPTGGYPAGFVALQVVGAALVSVPAGTYYLIVKADADNQINESDENNNTIVSRTVFTVTGGSTGGSTTCTNSILKNAGFENGLADWGGGGEISNTNAFSGTNALKLCKLEERVFQSQAAQAGKTYSFRLYAKNDANTEGYFGIKFMSAAFVPIDFQLLPINSLTYSTNTTNGTTLSRVAPTGTAYVEVFVAKSLGTGCVYADDWCLTEGGGVTNPCDTDSELPKITCPVDLTINIPATQDAASVAIPQPTASDNCGITSTTLTRLTGETFNAPNGIGSFPVGLTTLRYTVSDAKGNKASCTYNTTVVKEQTGGGGADIALAITATPNIYKKWTNLTFNISAKNNGNTAFSNVKVQFKFPAGTVSGGASTASVGAFSEWCAGGIQCFEWAIPSLAANSTATLQVPVFVLDVSGALVGTTTLTGSTPVDAVTTNNTATISVNGTAPEPQAGLIQKTPTPSVPVVIQTIAPNPSEGDAIINVESLENQTVTINFFNSLGKLIGSEKRQVVKGSNILYFDTTNYDSGLYFISTEYQKTPVKFVKM